MAWDARTRMILGDEAVQRLNDAHVAVFGLGGVGGHLFEALVRSGVGQISIIDGDVIDETNLNRQLLAEIPYLGYPKTELANMRAAKINPKCVINEFYMFYRAENANEIDFSGFDYVADCIDTVASKLLIIENCKQANVPVISCMGTGNKLDPSKLKIADISKTDTCPLAKVMRRELRTRGITDVKALYSTEEPLKPIGGGRTPGSVSFVPSAAGLMIASEIVRYIAKI